MPFTPFHMGPGLFIKALLGGSFSLMIFGWAQILMDLQPLWVMTTGHGALHGLSHSYLGASLIALVAALSGKPLCQWLSHHCRQHFHGTVQVSWLVALVSAFIGTLSHVALDSIMHYDVTPLYPLSQENALYQLVGLGHLHLLLLVLGCIGALIYFSIQRIRHAQGAKPGPEAD